MKELSDGWFLFYSQYRKANTLYTNHRRKTSMNIKDRIAKLLALAESPNEHEAKAALLKARELMAEYKLRPEEISRSKDEKVIRRTTDITCTKMTNTWATRLSAIIASHYCCRAYRTHKKGAKKVTIGFVGLEEDFEICCRIFRYAYDCINSRCQQIRKKYQGLYHPSYLREITNAYGDGFCNGLIDAFAKQEKQHDQTWGIVLVTPQSVLDAISAMGKATAYGSIDCSGSKKKYALEGYEDGKKFDPSTKLQETIIDPKQLLV